MQPTDLLDRFPSTLANSVHDETAMPFNRLVSQPEPGVTLVEPIRFLHTTTPDGTRISDSSGKAWPVEVEPTITVDVVIKWAKMTTGWVAILHPEQKAELSRILQARLGFRQPLHSIKIWSTPAGEMSVVYNLLCCELYLRQIETDALPVGLSVSSVAMDSVTMKDYVSAWASRPAWLIGPVK